MQSLHVQCYMPVGLATLLVSLFSSDVALASHNCSLSGAQFSLSTVTVTAESVDGATPGARVTWSTTAPPECVGSVRVEFRTNARGAPVATYTTTNTSETEVIQTGLQCGTHYYITVVVAGRLLGSVFTTRSRAVRVLVGDIPTPVGVRAEATTDNTSIRVSWEWLRQGDPMCVDLVRVNYQPEGGSLMRYTMDNTTATSATLRNLQCNTEYIIWVYVEGGQTGKRSVSRRVSLPARAPPTPTEVTAQPMSVSSIRLAWQWTRSGPAPNCFNTTRVTYRFEGGGESSLQLSDPAATEVTLTNLRNKPCATITVVATAGEHRREGTAFLPLQGPRSLSAAVLGPTSVHLTWVAPCHTQQYHIYYRGTCGAFVDEGSLDTDQQEYIFDGLQEDINYIFTVNQTGFNRGRVLSTGPVHARTFTAVPSGTPQSLEATFVGPTEVFFWWRELPCAQQNGPIVGYVVQYYATCGAYRDVQLNKSVVTTGDIIHDLTPNTEYGFQVAAVNVNGTGPFSEAITLGGAPWLVTVTVINPTTVTVSWSEVKCFNGSGAVTHYLVQCRSIYDGAIRNVATNSSEQDTIVSKLSPNFAQWTFRVAAVYNQSIGPFSNFFNSTVSLGKPAMFPTENSDETSTQLPGHATSLEAWAVAGAAVTAVLVLLLVAVVQSAVICHLWRSTSRMTSQSQRITDITMTECSAYGEIGYGGGRREDTPIYEFPCTFVHSD